MRACYPRRDFFESSVLMMKQDSIGKTRPSRYRAGFLASGTILMLLGWMLIRAGVRQSAGELPQEYRLQR